MQWTVSILEFYVHYTLLEHTLGLFIYAGTLPSLTVTRSILRHLTSTGTALCGLCGLAQRLTALLALAAVSTLPSSSSRLPRYSPECIDLQCVTLCGL